jgi:glycosyltransferase involved in cell wall biosynthesis
MPRPEPLVSVIVPVFNEEQHLGECLESVLAQSYTKWDLTVVNNQSADRSLEIAEAYARRDQRIRVVTTPVFYPQLRNHNLAIQRISPDSTYCKFINGDSWIFPDCLRLMVAAAEAQPTVGIVSGLVLSTERLLANSLPYPSAFMSGRSICRRQLRSGEDYFGSPTMLLYRSEVVRARHPFFREDAVGADVDACYEILKTWNFAFVHQLLSYNRTDNVSIGSRSRQYSTFALNQYLHLTRHGRAFLTADENTAAHQLWELEYYGFLATRAMESPGREFWDYHSEVLATIGERLSVRLLAKHVLNEIADLLLNPKKTLGRALRSARQPSALAAQVAQE